MNRDVLNGSALGDGVASVYVRMTAPGTATAAGSVAIYAKRSLVSAVTPTATTVLDLTGEFGVGGVVSAVATAAVSFGTYIAKYVASAITAFARHVLSWYAKRSLSASETADVASVIDVTRTPATFFTSSVAATASDVSTLSQQHLFQSDVTASATSETSAYVGVSFDSESVTTSVTSDIDMYVGNARAATERVTIVPFEDRTSEVV